MLRHSKSTDETLMMKQAIIFALTAIGTYGCASVQTSDDPHVVREITNRVGENCSLVGTHDTTISSNNAGRMDISKRARNVVRGEVAAMGANAFTLSSVSEGWSAYILQYDVYECGPVNNS